jgi:hypothetical protein
MAKYDAQIGNIGKCVIYLSGYIYLNALDN